MGDMPLVEEKWKSSSGEHKNSILHSHYHWADLQETHVQGHRCKDEKWNEQPESVSVTWPRDGVLLVDGPWCSLPQIDDKKAHKVQNAKDGDGCNLGRVCSSVSQAIAASNFSQDEGKILEEGERGHGMADA